MKHWLNSLIQGEATRLTFLFFISFLLFLINLGSTALWDNSEPTYAEISREILSTGDWFTMHYEYRNWYVHPPLYFWLTALGIKLFGLGEAVVRFWSAFFGACGIVAVYFLGKHLYDSRTGFWAAVILATTLEYFILSRIVLMDTLLNFFTVLALVGFLLAYQKKSSRYFLLFYGSAALAILAKGPVGIVLPLMLIFAFLLIKREFSFFLKFFHWPGLLLLAAILSPWYLSQILMHGKDFLMINIAHYTFTRYVGVVENQPGPVYYYIPVLLAGFFPWVGFLPWVMAYHWRHRKNDSSLFLLLGMSIIFIFFSFSGTKQPNYIITFFPLAAVAVACFFMTGRESIPLSLWKSPLWRGGLAAFGLAVLLTVAGTLAAPSIPKVYAESAPYLIPLAVLWLSGTFLYLLALLWKRTGPLPVAVQASVVILLYLYVIYGLFPEIEQYKYTKPFALYLKENSGAAPVVGYNFRLPSMVYYLDGKTRSVDGQQLKALRDQKTSFYLVTDEPNFNGLGAGEYVLIKKIATGVLAAPVYPIHSANR